MSDGSTSVVFVHGLWLHASSWNPWVELFRGAGYDPIAPGWPATPETVEAARANPDQVAGVGIDDVAHHYAEVIAGLGSKPVLIGHSFGGLIVQKLHGQGLAAAAVAIDPAPIKGVILLPLSALRVASIALRNPANYRKRAVSLTSQQFRYGFGNALSDEESNELFERWTIPSPGKPLFEAAFANFAPHSPARVDTGNTSRGPLLLIAGGRDHTVSAATVRSTFKLYRKSPAVTEIKEFPDRGHTIALDHGWREVADAILTWLDKQTI